MARWKLFPAPVVNVNITVPGMGVVLAELHRLETKFMGALEDLNTQLTALRDGQQEVITNTAELLKDQDRVLARLAEVLQGQNPDLSAAVALVTEIQDKNAQQLAAIQAADAALEAAVPENTDPPVEPTDPNARRR